jgi:hypothetical protein
MLQNSFLQLLAMLNLSDGQVGIMLSGTMIDNTVVGGPAHNSKQFEHGDVVLEVDGHEANNGNIFELLIGNDTPGSVVEVRLAKGDPKAKSYLSIKWFSGIDGK